MILIVGLGNPEAKYLNTRHNVGFLGIDVLAEKTGIIVSKKKAKAVYGKGGWKQEILLLAKPQTYMNLSGLSVRMLAATYKVTCEQIWVIQDDLDMPPGRFKIKQGGSAGGHKGIRSIIEETGQENFLRFKIGIGKPPPKMNTEQFVLQPFSDTEIPFIQASIHVCVDSILHAVEHPLSETLTQFNTKQIHGLESYE